MKRILFVCHGNICRSPMAEFIMKKLVRTAGLEEEFEIASAATSTEEIGNPVYPMARQELAKHGIGCPGHHARQLTTDDYDHYDMIIGMEAENIKNMMRILGADPDGKLSLLLDHTDHPRDIADPWYTRKFNIAWADIYEGCTALFNKLTADGRAAD
ncbi:MAG: low molecular weight phosphotyrosine protein phosphatase [Bacteroidales bacterium]|nr:low molecular weight phosphotyrosine protein phosphatase [Bacteroidales bacterium]